MYMLKIALYYKQYHKEKANKDNCQSNKWNTQQKISYKKENNETKAIFKNTKKIEKFTFI